MRSHRIYDGPETCLPANAGIVLLLDEQFLNILMERTKQLKSDIESGPVADEIVKRRWEAMDSELVHMKPIYLNYHVGAGNSQFRFQSHRARSILNTSLDYILPTSMVYKYHFVYERMFPPKSLPVQEYVSVDAGERERFKRLNDLHNEWYLLFRYIVQSGGGYSANPPMNPSRPMDMLTPQADEGMSLDDGFQMVCNRWQGGNSGGFGHRRWDGGTPSNSYEDELKEPEAQSYTSEFGFDENFMRGFLEWKNQLSESMIRSYGECGSSEEDDGSETGDYDPEWIEDGDMKDGRGWTENEAADGLGAVVTWLQQSDENSGTSLSVEA